MSSERTGHDVDHEKPDERIQYVRSVEFAWDDAEDVKIVRFKGDSKVIEVGITDETMVEFLKVAEEVYTKIHTDMAEMYEIFRSAARSGRDTDKPGGER